MVVKSELKLIKSLQQKKYRNEHGLFVVEGKKMLEDVLRSEIKPFKLLAVAPEAFDEMEVACTKISKRELGQISSLKNPNGFLGVFHIPDAPKKIGSNWILVLDGIQDPGNLGTIIRLCDWFGITDVVCSGDTADCYSPKVLQATMGSIARVNVHYFALDDFLKTSTLPIYGTFMAGVALKNVQLPNRGILIMGNEGKGISEGVAQWCTEKITIPQFGDSTAESLNVASATAIVLSEIRR